MGFCASRPSSSPVHCREHDGASLPSSTESSSTTTVPLKYDGPSLPLSTEPSSSTTALRRKYNGASFPSETEKSSSASALRRKYDGVSFPSSTEPSSSSSSSALSWKCDDVYLPSSTESPSSAATALGRKNNVASLLSSNESSSSTTARPWKYDVFLSFRGADTRKGITFELYDRLHNKRGITTFKDDRDLEVGDAISPALLKAIEESRFAIVVLSPNYASSTWCLEELAKICECMEEKNRVLPLFFNVEPSDVRHLNLSFKEAFDKHKSSGRHTPENMQRWRDALNKVANFSGWDAKNYKTDRELVDAIVDSVCKRIQPFEIEFTMSTGDFETYTATRKAMVEVMKALKDDDVTTIGGVGKTTMVKHVAVQFRKCGNFNFVITLVVSQSPDLTKIQGTLADMLGVELEVETVSVRAAKLYKEIMTREKILIILDDVWNRIELSAIGIPSYEELQKCNSKVILTTRRLHICDCMHSQASIPLNILSREDSWNLFVRTARRSFESITFESVARKVAGECKGLPIALIAVARALRDKDEAEWQKAARRLEKSQSATVEDEEDSFRCIKLSYDYLKDEDSKSCFLLGCLFPEDYDIPVQDLLKYAIGTGLFQDETIDESRGTADSVVKYLKDSCLLMDSKEKGCVKMHDVIRDTALNIAKSKDGHGFLVKAGCGLKHWPLGSYQGYSAISLMRNHIWKLPEEELVCPNLQILLLKQNYLTEIPKKLIQSLDKLRLLDLSNTGFSSLPESCSLLTNLQALYLDFCHNLMKICTVGKLKKLEILSMRKYPGRELSKEIGHLTNLRILDISCASIVTIPSKVVSKLHKLQELYMLYCKFEHWGCEVEGQGEETNIGFDELAGLSNLRMLQVCILDAKYIPKNVEAAPSWIYFHIRFIRSKGSGVYNQEDQNQEHPNSRTLNLEATISTLPDWFINVVTKKTEKLEYRRYRGMRDIVMEYDHCKLHELNHLRVCGDFLDSYVYLKELMNTTRRVQKGPVFKNLEELHLIYLHLEELCVGELPPGSFLNLKVLNIHCCVMLKTVSKFVQRLPNLEKLYLKWMEQLEYVFGCEGFEPKQSNLREVNLLDLDALRSICNGPVPREMFQSLKSLKIYRCELLQSLFAFDVAECLVQLEDLSVERCRLLESVIEGVNNEKTVLPNLKNLVLINLPKLYGASSAADIECPSLEHLIVEECPQFQFSSSTSSSLFEASWNQLLFSKCAYEYFGCRNPFNLNDSQLCNIIYDDSQLCDIVYDC